MTSRERILSALSCKEPDRVPISAYELVVYDEDDWYNQRQSYKPLMDLVWKKTDCLYMVKLPAAPFGNMADAVRGTQSQEAAANENVGRKKWKEGKSTFIETILHTPKGELKSLHRMDENIFTVWTLEHLLKTIDDIDKYLSFDWGQGKEPDLSDFAHTQKRLSENGIMMPSLSDPICEVAEFFEMGQVAILGRHSLPCWLIFLGID